MSVRLRTQCALLCIAAVMASQAVYAGSETMLGATHEATTPHAQFTTPAMPVHDAVSAMLDHCLQSVVSVSFSYSQADLFSSDGFNEHVFSDMFDTLTGTQSRFVTSGVVVSQDGYILTHIPTAHVAGEWQVTLPDNSTHAAQLVGSDAISGFALLKINATQLVPVMGGTMTHLSSWSFALGRPDPHRASVVAGHVTSWRANIHLSPYQSYITTDMHDGQQADGGLLIDTQGVPEGIVIVVTHPSGYANTLAMPITEALAIADQLKAHGRVNYGYLGVIVEEQSTDEHHTPAVSGVRVSSVRPGSPADKAHIMTGDIIMHVNTVPVHSVYDLMGVVGQSTPGTRTVVDVNRQGKELRLIATISSMPEMKSDVRSIHIAMADSKTSPFEGATFVALTAKEKTMHHLSEGIKVTAVKKGSSAEHMGLAAGDMIIRVNGKTLSEVSTLEKLLSQPHSSVAVMIRNQMVTIDLS